VFAGEGTSNESGVVEKKAIFASFPGMSALLSFLLLMLLVVQR